jgi:hypothetical protein
MRFMSIGAVLLALGLARPAFAAPGPPDDLGQWGLHCFCIAARHTPQRVIRIDGNGRVLNQAVGGTTLGALKASGLAVTDSQVLLLKTYGLIDQTGDRITTAFPVIGPEAMLPLRARLSQLAAATAPALAGDARSIGQQLKADGFADHAYAVVFGYALDGLLWDELRRRGALPDTALDLDHPIWRGAFWAIYPERADVPGTNESQVGDRALVSVWTDRTVEPLAALTDAHAGPAKSDAWLSRLPVIHAAAGDPIHAAAGRLAARAALASVPHASQQEAVLILAHEFIWDLTEDLVRDGAIATPPALSRPAATPKQLEALLFLRAAAGH